MKEELAEFIKPEYINFILIATVLVAITVIITAVITIRNRQDIITFLSDIRKSLYMQEGGFSTRKMIAWFGTWTAGSLTLKFATQNNVDILLQTWLFFVAACLGMVVYGDIQKKKIETTANAANTTVPKE